MLLSAHNTSCGMDPLPLPTRPCERLDWRRHQARQASQHQRQQPLSDSCAASPPHPTPRVCLPAAACSVSTRLPLHQRKAVETRMPYLRCPATRLTPLLTSRSTTSPSPARLRPTRRRRMSAVQALTLSTGPHHPHSLLRRPPLPRSMHLSPPLAPRRRAREIIDHILSVQRREAR